MPAFKISFAIIALLNIAGGVAQTMAQPPYAITARLKGPDSRWDLMTADAASRRLLLARVGGVTTVDLTRNIVTDTLVAIKVAHGATPIPRSTLAVATSETTNSLIWFDAASGKRVGTTPVGEEPDGVIYDPTIRKVLSLNAHDLTIVDPLTRKAVGRIALPGEPEFGAVDDRGHLYENIRDQSRIAVIDLRKRKITRSISLRECKEPTGIAYDKASGLVISVCGSGVAKIMNAATGHEIASIPVGEGADAVILDEQRRTVFIPSGHSGTLSIISLADPRHPALLQVLPTKIGTRTGAVDPATGMVYLPSAEFAPPSPGVDWPGVIPGTMSILVVARGRSAAGGVNARRRL